MDKLKSFMLSWKGAVVVVFVVLGAISNACGGSKGEKVVNKDGETVEINYYHPSAYIDAVNNQDFELAHKVLDKLYARYLNAYNDRASFLYDQDEDYWSGAKHVYKGEMMWLLPQNDQEANKRMIFTLQNMNIIGDKPSTSREYDGYANIRQMTCYIDFITKYNSLCSDILDISIANGNEDMANRIVKLFKENFTPHEGKNSQNNTIYTYTLDRGEIEAAKAKLAEAKADGSFE